MRKVDHFCGVPLCFLGTLLQKPFALAARPGDGAPPRNVLCIELSEMGSSILADPALQKLRQVGGCELFFTTFKKNRPCLELLGTVPDGNIYTIDEGSFSSFVRDTAGFFLWARRKRIDAVIDMEMFSRYSALLTGFSGARRRVGFHAFQNEGLYRGGFLTHPVAYNPHQHMSKNFIALANALLSARAELPFSKTLILDEEVRIRKRPVSREDRNAIERTIKAAWPAYDARAHRIVLFNTNASALLPIRRWPRENYIALARTILDRYPDILILLIGGKDDITWAETIASAVRSNRCVNFAGHTSLTDLPALYTGSLFMLSNDSGPPHFASVTDMPMFVLFGPETPKLYCPLGNATPIYAGLACSPCVSAANHRQTVCADNVCLQLITADRVFGLLRPLLDRGTTNTAEAGR